ncbi:hypothetical protein ACQ4PT_051756 [Festuca glaucescens]
MTLFLSISLPSTHNLSLSLSLSAGTPGHEGGALSERGRNRRPAFTRLDREPLTALVAGDPHLEPTRPTPILIPMKLACHYLYKKVTSERSSQGTIVEVDLRSLKPCEFPGETPCSLHLYPSSSILWLFQLKIGILHR